MKLYLANCTRQRETVFYRLDFNKDGTAQQRVQALKHVVVEPGKQAIVGGDLQLSQCDTIIQQLEAVGGVSVAEINRLPKRPVAYLLSIDKQITARQMLMVHHHNMDVLREQGDVRKANSAVAINSVVEQAIESQTKEFEVEIEQDSTTTLTGEDVPGKPVEFGARVSRTEEPAKPVAPRGGRRGRR